MNTLKEIKLNLVGEELTGYDCGERWNGFIVPLFGALQVIAVSDLLKDYDIEFTETDYRSEETGEALFIINSGFCFELDNE